MRRLIAAFAAIVATAGFIVALPAISASAATAPTIVTCTGVSGNLTGTMAVNGCSNTGITGGSGALSINLGARTFRVTWKSKKTTTGAAIYTLVPAVSCPSGNAELIAAGTVRGGTAAALINGTTTFNLCVNESTGNVRLVAGTKYKV